MYNTFNSNITHRKKRKVLEMKKVLIVVTLLLVAACSPNTMELLEMSMQKRFIESFECETRSVRNTDFDIVVCVSSVGDLYLGVERNGSITMSSKPAN